MATQAQCEHALDLFEDELSRRKNVVGLGIVSDEEAQSKGCRVAVYVKKKEPAGKLSKKDLVPETLTVPGHDGPIQIPTKVIEQGEVRLERVGKELL
jgi:hypothetical protein